MANANPFRFSSKYADDETDLCYYGYRFYSHSVARWLSRDPLDEEGGSDTYCFVQNSPITETDADGRLAWVYKGDVQPANFECGGWNSAWVLTGIKTTKPVWLVSQITETYSVTSCAGQPLKYPTKPTYEARKIEQTMRDRDSMGEHFGTFGKQGDKVVTAIFPDKKPYSSAVPNWGHQVAYSGDMYSTYTKPSWWNNPPETATRTDSSSWNCCCGNSMQHDHSPK